MGKALGGILRYAKEEAVPVIAIGGCVEACEILNEMGFASIFPYRRLRYLCRKQWIGILL